MTGGTISSGPMQVVSGPIGKERVHYQAPPADRLSAEMSQFLDWFNGPASIDPVLKAAQAHLWFVTIHPFDDGNGRIARAIADLALARSEQSPKRFYSMSAQIRLERNDYYEILEQTQKGTLDVTAWMQWFLGCLDRAFDGAEATLAGVLRKARFWEVPRRGIVQRPAAEDRQPPARRVRGQADLVEMGEDLPSARRTRPAATSTTWSNAAYWRRMLPEAGARATRSSNRPGRPDQIHDLLHDVANRIGSSRIQWPALGPAS